MQTPAPRAAQWAQCWHLTFLSQPREDGLGEISVVLWFGSQLSVVAALPLVCTVQLLLWSPGMGSSTYFVSHPDFYRFITLHKHGGNICKVSRVEVLHLLDHVDLEKSFCGPGASFVRSWGWGGISLLFKWPDKLCCDVQALSRLILELNYMLDLLISSRNVFPSWSLCQ